MSLFTGRGGGGMMGGGGGGGMGMVGNMVAGALIYNAIDDIFD